MHSPSVVGFPPTTTKRAGFFSRLFAPRCAMPGEAFGAPGQGNSSRIATVTVIAVLLLWFGVTASGMVKPLFLPSPQAVYEKFIMAATTGFGGATLWEHTVASASSAPSAWLACWPFPSA